MEVKDSTRSQSTPSLTRNPIAIGLILALLIAVFSSLYYGISNTSTREISAETFKSCLNRGLIKQYTHFKNQDYVGITLNKRGVLAYNAGEILSGPRSHINPTDQGNHLILKLSYTEQLDKILGSRYNRSYRVDTSQSSDLLAWLSSGLYILFMISMLWLLFRGTQRMDQSFGIVKSKATLFNPKKDSKVTFKDIAGMDEVKESVKEIVSFLKNPDSITKLGGRVPQGALLIGPPGTGKTLLAKAIAGEADVPFFYASGTSFSGMFVGVGTERVEQLFRRAEDKKPCIIFIDEIDAVGRKRSSSTVVGGSFDTENTLNTLLIEMDGFAPNQGIIVLAATNRPEILDKALMRPGRFDRKILFNLPTIKEREAIFKVHLKKIKSSVRGLPKTLSKQTPGFSGAEIANVCNEGAITAANKNKSEVEMSDFQEAIDRVIAGLEKKSMIISREEKGIIAHHEAGHGVASWFLENAHPLVKVTIVPRGIALGYAQFLPKEQSLHQKEQLMDEMCSLLGGRAAEQIIFKRISTGAQNDLEQVTRMAYNMVNVYGMSTNVGNLSFYHPKEDQVALTKPYSEHTAQMIDEEVRRIVNDAYKRALGILRKWKKELKLVAKELLKNEVVYEKDLERILGKRPFGQKKERAEVIQGDVTTSSEAKFDITPR